MDSSRTKKGGFAHAVLSVMLSVILIVGLAPTVPSTAFADDENAGGSTDVSTEAVGAADESADASLADDTADATMQVTCTPSKTMVKPGEEFTCDFSVADCPGVAALGTHIKCDNSNVSIKKVEKVNNAGLPTMTTFAYNDGIVSMSNTGTENDSEAGVFMRATLSVNSAAQVGGTATISLKAEGEDADWTNKDYQPVAHSDTPATVTIANMVKGGDTITANGVYSVESGATGLITVNESLNDVTVVGKGSAETFTDLCFDIGDGSTVTAKDLYIARNDQASGACSTKATMNFKGSGTFNVEGTNLFDCNYSNSSPSQSGAVIHVGKGKSLQLGGSGVLYSYKHALNSLIGGDANEANGAITINSGTWFLKGSKTGPIIGGDSTTDKGDTITITGGNLYLKAVAQGAAIGGSKQGLASDVKISGGLIEISVDFSGSAIGYGGNKTTLVGNLDITGGSLKVIATSNAYSSWGITDTTHSAVSTSAPITNNYEEGLLVFDASDYASQASVTVKVDGKDFYTGSLYKYVTNEVKNPDGNVTSNNWISNDQEYASAYPCPQSGAAKYSAFAPDKNLYLYLSKESHKVEVNGTTYSYKWNAETGQFERNLDPYEWYDKTATEFTLSTADQLAEFANIVNGTVPAEYSIDQDSFANKTVKLGADIDLSSNAGWTPIGNATYSFAGTFDGANKSITGMTVSLSSGYAGLFGKTAATASIKDFKLAGSVTSSASNKDYVGGVVAYNMGSITGVVSSASATAGNVYNVGGIAGFNDGGYNANIGTTPTGGKGSIDSCACTGNVTGLNKVGGIVGENSGSITKSYASGTVDGTNTSSKNGVGGIVGRNGNNNTALEEGTVDSCYFVGTVGRSGQKWVGGIAGLNNSKSSVKNCYMAGTLIAGEGFYNSIVGNQEGSASNNYALSYTTSGTTEAEIGIVVTSDQLKSRMAALALNGEGSAFNLDDATEQINNGYPVLAWQGGTAAVAGTMTAVGTIPSQEYTGSDLTPVLTGLVIKDGDDALWSSMYTLTDSSTVKQKNAGSHEITVATGKGAYKDKTATSTFTITPKDISALATIDSIDDQTYTGSEIKPSITVKLDGTALTQGTDYTVSYTNNIDAGTATVTANFTGNYSGSKSATFTIKPASIAGASITVDDQTYTGSAIVPAAATVKLGDKVLEQGTDFTIGTCGNNVNVTDAATIEINGVGNYTGTASGTFKIVAAEFTVDPLPSVTYTGAEIEPVVTVKSLSGTTLTKGTDYEVAYSDNKAVGTAKATVTGKGNYTGEITVNFAITARQLDEITGDAAGSITIAGPLKDGSTAEANKVESGSTNYEKAKSKLMTDTYDALIAREIKVYDDEGTELKTFEEPGLTISFTVGSEYNGRTIQVYKWHFEESGSYTQTDLGTFTVENGAITVSGITTLSQFNLLVQKVSSGGSSDSGSSSVAKTGDSPLPFVLGGVALVALAGLCLAFSRRRIQG